MSPELTTIAQIIGVAIVSGLTYWATQRKSKTTTETGIKDAKNYADNLINVQNARVADLEQTVERLQLQIDTLVLQLREKQMIIETLTNERDLARSNQSALQKELQDSQSALHQTLQRADEMEKRMEALEKQQTGSDAVKVFVDQVMTYLKNKIETEVQ